MRIFLTGANGFIGGAVAKALIAAGHRVRGLVRDKTKAELVAAHGIEAVVGSLDDAAVLHAEAQAADAAKPATSRDQPLPCRACGCWSQARTRLRCGPR